VMLPLPFSCSLIVSVSMLGGYRSSCRVSSLVCIFVDFVDNALRELVLIKGAQGVLISDR
ncbi:MAG: hypothetical protein RBT36_05760, partial [Desulfobulbus sp.]|nr:hypothetical protein [Desulfobulbus sp.]